MIERSYTQFTNSFATVMPATCATSVLWNKTPSCLAQLLHGLLAQYCTARIY
jgi:hypothetical protein